MPKRYIRSTPSNTLTIVRMKRMRCPIERGAYTSRSIRNLIATMKHMGFVNTSRLKFIEEQLLLDVSNSNDLSMCRCGAPKYLPMLRIGYYGPLSNYNTCIQCSRPKKKYMQSSAVKLNFSKMIGMTVCGTCKSLFENDKTYSLTKCTSCNTDES